jgi:hypothetical protein
MKPFRSKSELNPSLHSKVIDWPRGPDGLPRGHADFDGGHPGLQEDFVDGVAIVEVLTASLGPKVVQDEGAGAPYSEPHLVRCNKLAECLFEFVTSSQDPVQCSLWQH